MNFKSLFLLVALSIGFESRPVMIYLKKLVTVLKYGSCGISAYLLGGWAQQKNEFYSPDNVTKVTIIYMNKLKEYSVEKISRITEEYK